MTRSAPSFSPRIPVLALLAATTFAFGCSKENKDGGDAAADATVEAAVADAAVADAAVADATVNAADAATAPLATTAAAKPKAPPPDPPICAAARAAKKRGSPAAPSLETQCKAAGGTL